MGQFFYSFIFSVTFAVLSDNKAVTTTADNTDGDGDDAVCWKEVGLTGGLDTKLCVCSVADYTTTRPKTLYPIPLYIAHRNMSIATQARYLSICYPTKHRIDVYRLKSTNELQVAPAAEQEATTISTTTAKMTRTALTKVLWKQAKDDNNLLCSIELGPSRSSYSSSNNLVCLTISADGSFLAVTDVTSLQLFHLQRHDASPAADDDGDSDSMENCSLRTENVVLVPFCFDISPGVRAKQMMNNVVGTSTSGGGVSSSDEVFITAMMFLPEVLLVVATTSYLSSVTATMLMKKVGDQEQQEHYHPCANQTRIHSITL
jgi:hypothetical protein